MTNDLHAAIMNLPLGKAYEPHVMEAREEIAYKLGHRDARHAAAELVAAHLSARPEPQAAVSEEAILPLPTPWDYCYEWTGPYGKRKFSAAHHNGRACDNQVPVYTGEQMREFARAVLAASRHDESPALGYATRLAEAIWRKHYATDAPNWKPLPDLLGVLTQIDNMTSGLAASRQVPVGDGGEK